MPGPGIYVVAVVVGVAAGIAFKEFVYDPHLAPKIEQWTGAFAAYRIERRRRRNVPQSYSHLDSDNKGDSSGPTSPTDADLQPKSLVETEMYTLGPEAALRQRKVSALEANNLEMIERPNLFLPFTPLSPSRLLPSSASTLNTGNVTMPITRLPGSSELGPSSPVSASSARPAGSHPSLSTPTPSGHSAPHVTSSMSDHGFVVTTSRGTSPFTSASVSRAGTPWSDARSASSIGLRSGTSYTDDASEMSFVSEADHPPLNLDHSLLHTTTLSQISLSNQSEISLEHSESSFDTSFTSSGKTESDASIDFLGSDADLDVDLVDALSPGSAPGMLSDEEWERLSEAQL